MFAGKVCVFVEGEGVAKWLPCHPSWEIPNGGPAPVEGWYIQILRKIDISTSLKSKLGVDF